MLSMLKTHTLFSTKLDVQGRWVAIMEHRRSDRAMQPSAFKTRCLKQSEIHEFIICEEPPSETTPINNVSYLGFGEIQQGGVVEVGDWLYIQDALMGQILGFDETHMPNHLNILIQSNSLVTGHSLGLLPRNSFWIRSHQS